MRPFVIGIGKNLGLKPAKKYLFSLVVTPVQGYFSDNSNKIRLCTTQYDRAPLNGLGNVKVGGNYGASLRASFEAQQKGYDDCLYLDSCTKKKIEETGTTNFIGITKNNEIITPKSESILNSITKQSVLEIAKNEFGMEAIERSCYINNLDEFIEVGVCGTASGIVQIVEIEHNGISVHFDKQGNSLVLEKLSKKLMKIQKGMERKYDKWIYVLE